MDTTETGLSPDQVQQHLEEKDQLIQALTDRLGEAAEQLDRIQRTGNDRGGRPAGASGEMQEQQRTLLENLSTTLERWEEVQPRDAFDRMETKLDHLRGLLESAVDSGFTPSASTSELTQESPPEPQPQPEPPAEALTGWEAMKAQLLDGGDTLAPATPTPAPQAPAIDDVAEAEPVAESTDSDEPASTDFVTAGADTPTPEPVDFATAEQNELEKAIEDRDGYIGYLTGRLRSEEQRTRQAIDWEALNNAPDDLREKLQELEADLEERLRIAEVDLSLERARLSRVQANIEGMQSDIERRLQSQFPSKTRASAKPAHVAAPVENGQSKGWFGKLGRK